MIRLREGRVTKIIKERYGAQVAMAMVEKKLEKIVNYPLLTGSIKDEDVVILNTTAVQWKLGTGGVHFVVFNYSHTALDPSAPGHIMKLRYTPFQIKCLCAEEAGPLANSIADMADLDGMPVIVCSLHSMIAPASIAIKLKSPKAKLAYIMTDGGSLPIYFSNLVSALKENNIIDVTITAGHAFGGDFESINIYSGLLCARAWGANAAIVAMGPGVVGTGTKFGHTGLELGHLVNAVGDLKGKPIAIPRISFADKRERHRGVSHHTLTALSLIAKYPAYVVMSDSMEENRRLHIEAQFDGSQISSKHSVLYRNGIDGLKYMAKLGIDVTSMGRNVQEDEDFFLTCSAAGNFLVEML